MTISVSDAAVEAACRAHDPIYDQCGGDTRSDMRRWMRAAIEAALPELLEVIPYRLGDTYTTAAGEVVVLVDVANEGTSYETMCCEAGVHRYTRRDFGRVTGSPFDYTDPRNIPPTYRLRHPTPGREGQEK